jgi:hypothetical protein
MLQLTDQIDANTTASHKISVDLFSPPFGVSSTTATVSDPNIEKLVSPPLVECTTINEKKRNHGRNVQSILCTPKHPKIICLYYFVSSKLHTTENESSTTKTESSRNSFDQEGVMSSSSSLNVDNTFLKKLSSVIPYPIKVWHHTSLEFPSITSFLDIVDMTSHPCCGYTYIFCMVDPVHRYGHAVVLKSISKDEICFSFTRLMTVVRIQPTMLYFDNSLNFLLDVSQKYPSIIEQ